MKTLQEILEGNTNEGVLQYDSNLFVVCCGAANDEDFMYGIGQLYSNVNPKNLYTYTAENGLTKVRNIDDIYDEIRNGGPHPGSMDKLYKEINGKFAGEFNIILVP